MHMNLDVDGDSSSQGAARSSLGAALFRVPSPLRWSLNSQLSLRKGTLGPDLLRKDLNKYLSKRIKRKRGT